MSGNIKGNNNRRKGLVEVTLRNINMRLNMPIVLFGKNEQSTHHHYHFHTPIVTNDAPIKHGSMATSAGVGCPTESGKLPVDSGNRPATGNEESQAADGMS